MAETNRRNFIVALLGTGALGALALKEATAQWMPVSAPDPDGLQAGFTAQQPAPNAADEYNRGIRDVGATFTLPVSSGRIWIQNGQQDQLMRGTSKLLEDFGNEAKRLKVACQFKPTNSPYTNGADVKAAQIFVDYSQALMDDLMHKTALDNFMVASGNTKLAEQAGPIVRIGKDYYLVQNDTDPASIQKRLDDTIARADAIKKVLLQSVGSAYYKEGKSIGGFKLPSINIQNSAPTQNWNWSAANANLAYDTIQRMHDVELVFASIVRSAPLGQIQLQAPANPYGQQANPYGQPSQPTPPPQSQLDENPRKTDRHNVNRLGA